MNTTYLEAAKERTGNLPLLVNIISRRVRQLNRGQRPMVKVDNPRMSQLDIALKEVAEGTLTAEMAFVPTESAAEEGETLLTL